MQNGGMGNEQGMNSTVNYTLPGIMQYLQSQFTQVERNRLQSELERSSLKLKIIELENERNSLLRKNQRLQITVDQLKQEIDTLKNKSNINGNSKEIDDKIDNIAKESIGKKKIKNNDGKSESEIDEILGSIHSLDISKIVHARKFLKSATNEILYLLKTPVVDLDNNANVGGITGISSHSGNNGNDLFFNRNITQPNDITVINGTNNNSDKSSITSSNNFIDQSNTKSNIKQNLEKDLNDILAAPFHSNNDHNVVESDAETIIDEPVNSKANAITNKNIIGAGDNDDGVDDDVDDDDDDDDEAEEDDDDDDDDDDEFDDDEFDDDDEEEEFDDEFDDEDLGRIDGNSNIDKEKGKESNEIKDKQIVKRKTSVESRHGKNEKEKLLSLLKKSPKKSSNLTFPVLKVKLYPNLSEMELKGGKLFTYYDKESVVRVYDDLLGKGNLVKEIHLPDANTIIDIITSEAFIIIATVDSLTVYTIDFETNFAITYNNIDAKSIDLFSNKILLVSNSSISILEIDLINKKINTITSFDYSYEGTLKKAKFVKNNALFDVSVLSSTTIYFYNTKALDSQNKLVKSLPLSEYHEWLITSRNLILRFNHGLFLFDFSNLSEFKSIPLPPFPDSKQASNAVSEVISSCVDDDTIFYILRCNDPSYTSSLLDESTGLYELDVFKVKNGNILSIKTLNGKNDYERYCVGKIENKYSICVTKGKEIQLQSLA